MTCIPPLWRVCFGIKHVGANREMFSGSTIRTIRVIRGSYDDTEWEVTLFSEQFFPCRMRIQQQQQLGQYTWPIPCLPPSNRESFTGSSAGEAHNEAESNRCVDYRESGRARTRKVSLHPPRAPPPPCAVKREPQQHRKEDCSKLQPRHPPGERSGREAWRSRSPFAWPRLVGCSRDAHRHRPLPSSASSRLFSHRFTGWFLSPFGIAKR